LEVVKVNIKNYLFKFLGVVVAMVMVIYLLPPINFASAVGYATWRNIDMSTAAPGFTPTYLVTAPSPATTGTSMTVNSSANYPTPPFVVTVGTVGTEAIEVTAISGNVWTIVRGYGGTTALTYTASSTTYISGPDTMDVSFVPATPATSIQAIVIDFCSDSPIYNASTCVTPTGMVIGQSNGTSIAIGSITGLTNTALYNTAYSKPNDTSRNDIIIANNGTGDAPASATTIPGTITTGSTSFAVSSSASYPIAQTANSNTWFYIQVGSEDMQVTNVSGTTWTVTRGALGTSITAAGTGLAISQPPITFTLYGIMNPTVTGSLYARLYTFNTYSTASTFAAASPITGTTYSTAAGANIDSGGIALEIVSTLTITAKVQEYLQFCIYTASGVTTGCNLTGSTVNLGNSSGILSIGAAYVDSSTRFDVATNASGYVAITFTGAPLSNGSLTIENSTLSGTGSTAASAYASTVGTNQFGLCAIAASSQPTNFNSAGLSFPTATYNNASCPSSFGISATYGGSAQFGLNIAQAASVYGDLLAIQKPGAEANGVISFLGNIAPSQIAGIYTTTFNFVASGTY
jgi:hypothetical protein